MNSNDFFYSLKSSPIIASVKSDESILQAVRSKAYNIFLLNGNVCNIGEKVNRIKDSGKNVFVHMDLVEGLSTKDEAVQFIREYTAVDGIISTKANQIRCAKSLGLITIQRFFLLDSRTLSNIYKQFASKDVDFIEVLPGCMPKVLHKITENDARPLIAGGFIYDEEDIGNALNAGAAGVSTSDAKLWNIIL